MTIWMKSEGQCCNALYSQHWKFTWFYQRFCCPDLARYLSSDDNPLLCSLVVKWENKSPVEITFSSHWSKPEKILKTRICSCYNKKKRFKWNQRQRRGILIMNVGFLFFVFHSFNPTKTRWNEEWRKAWMKLLTGYVVSSFKILQITL